MAVRGIEVEPLGYLVDVASRAELAYNSIVGDSLMPAIPGYSISDKDQFIESVAEDFKLLGADSSDRETYVQLPVLNSKHFTNVLRTFTPTPFPLDQPDEDISKRLWTLADQTSDTSFSVAEVNGQAEVSHLKLGIQARVALLNASSPQEPLLHGSNMPYDAMHANAGQETQVQYLENIKASEQYSSFVIEALNPMAVLLIARQRLIEGRTNKDIKLPMNWGFMRFKMPRKTVDGDSWVGSVYSYGSQLGFDRSHGSVDSRGGVGVSMGLSE